MAVGMMQVVKVDENEKGLIVMRREPLGRPPEHSLCGPLEIGRLLARLRPNAKGAVVEIESLVQPEARVEDVTTDECGGAVPVSFQDGSERYGAAAYSLAVFLDAMDKG